MIRNRRGGLPRTARKLLPAIVAACLALAPCSALAGKEGVYVSDSVYFTLDKVRFSAASDDSILRFTVNLHNGGSGFVDYNGYGVRVTDSSGYSYSAQLTGKQSARVQAGKEQPFAYEARVAKGLDPKDLRVTLFRWNYGGGVSMSDIGSLSVASAMEESAAAEPEAVVPLAQVDSALSADAKVSFRLGGTYTVYQNDEWNVYADLIAVNSGDTGLVLPSGLKMRLENADGETVAVTALDGADKSLLPGKAQRITVHAAVPDSDAAGSWSLQFYTANGTNVSIWDSLELGGRTKLAAIGEARPITDAQGQEVAAVQVTSAVVSQSDDGQSVRMDVQVANNGSRVVAVPSLSAVFQSGKGGIAVQGTDAETHAAYLSQGETETFSFTALLPKGLPLDELQAALFEKRGGSTSAGASTAGASGSGNANANANANAGSNGASGTNGTAAASGKSVPVLIADLKRADAYALGDGEIYTIGQPIRLALEKNTEVSVAELKTYDNENYGFKTVVAKLRIANYDKSALALPELNLDLRDESGRVYTGTRQTNVIAQLASNSSYMVTYSFAMSDADLDKPFTLRVYKGKETIPLGAVKVGVEQENDRDDVWDVYPYKIRVKESDLLNGVLNTTFSYTMTLNVDLQRKALIISDSSVSKLQFDIVDPLGLVLSSQTLPFLGATRLLNGENFLTFGNLKVNQFSTHNYAVVYEVVDTPNGVVKRKLGEIR
ncbi:hypothetical protein [Paenibacillus flagellatus]|uniref:Uncharacterized protein n=1 Tax=Paenibacillus flagellatus TaxID=2211139 RepID=A0A2V5K9F9_9BACL|nr:hypothetical protein [Paenibacillus flagellatus]PYI55492.1 hypothetical protein DLM86_07090 [Paenibacillus flagellatus]